MSVRAHRIVKIEYAEGASFNLWHDDQLVGFLDRTESGGLWSQLNDDGGGVVNLSTETLQKAIDKAGELELDKETVAALQADIAAAKDQGNEYVEYDCF